MPTFSVIIRYAGTTGPEGIHAGFTCNTKEEGKARLAEEMAMLIFPENFEVQIFKND